MLELSELHLLAFDIDTFAPSMGSIGGNLVGYYGGLPCQRGRNFERGHRLDHTFGVALTADEVLHIKLVEDVQCTACIGTAVQNLGDEGGEQLHRLNVVSKQCCRIELRQLGKIVQSSAAHGGGVQEPEL